MRKFTIRLSALAITATALVVAPAIMPAPAKAASRHTHMTRHHWHRAHHDGAAWRVVPAAPVIGSYQADSPVCPGIGRSFDCKIWPPPFEDDPDRKASKF